VDGRDEMMMLLCWRLVLVEMGMKLVVLALGGGVLVVRREGKES